MQRQRVLHDGDHHYHVILGEQALYTNIGGPEIMRGQITRLLRDIDLPSLTLGIVTAAAGLPSSPFLHSESTARATPSTLNWFPPNWTAPMRGRSPSTTRSTPCPRELLTGRRPGTCSGRPCPSGPKCPPGDETRRQSVDRFGAAGSTWTVTDSA
ncbi:Scr1 family TA system antitoxin-like transcriptional regulator [Streptomyces sp. NPDC046371]|uniref:Scr1 family TA system antitoxin-like transcriptional regulator n=1 Tax=Streptomyces sp. NPDC046371 TaxID=3154916 RepID=UPI0033FF278F